MLTVRVWLHMANLDVETEGKECRVEKIGGWKWKETLIEVKTFQSWTGTSAKKRMLKPSKAGKEVLIDSLVPKTSQPCGYVQSVVFLRKCTF